MLDDIPFFYHLINYNINNVGIPLHQSSPEIGKSLILQAVAHSQSLGYKLHPNYNLFKDIFFDINENTYPITFEFAT